MFAIAMCTLACTPTTFAPSLLRPPHAHAPSRSCHFHILDIHREASVKFQCHHCQWWHVISHSDTHVHINIDTAGMARRAPCAIVSTHAAMSINAHTQRASVRTCTLQLSLRALLSRARQRFAITHGAPVAPTHHCGALMMMNI